MISPIDRHIKEKCNCRTWEGIDFGKSTSHNSTFIRCTEYRIYSRNSRSEDDALWQTEENVDEESESEEDYSSEEESSDA